jgi:dihydrofolate reductase
MTEAGARKLVVTEFVTLDGVMQAPGLPDEDTEGGFKHGGWQQPYFDDVFAKAIDNETIAAADALLLGRRTYDIFAGYWPKAKDPLAERMNAFTKYVASTTRSRVDWQNSILIKGDVAPEVAKLKRQPGRNLLVFGSGTLVQTLIRHDLVDELLLAIHPLILGSGKRLFTEKAAGSKRSFELVESRPTTKGVLIARYRAGAAS